MRVQTEVANIANAGDVKTAATLMDAATNAGHTLATWQRFAKSPKLTRKGKKTVVSAIAQLSRKR